MMRCLCIQFLVEKCWKTWLFVGSQNREELDNELAYGMKQCLCIRHGPFSSRLQHTDKSVAQIYLKPFWVSLSSQCVLNPSALGLLSTVLVLTCLLSALINLAMMLCTMAVHLLLAPYQFTSRAEWVCSCHFRPGLGDLRSLWTEEQGEFLSESRM